MKGDGGGPGEGSHGVIPNALERRNWENLREGTEGTYMNWKAVTQKGRWRFPSPLQIYPGGMKWVEEIARVSLLKGRIYRGLWVCVDGEKEQSTIK